MSLRTSSKGKGSLEPDKSAFSPALNDKISKFAESFSDRDYGHDKDKKFYEAVSDIQWEISDGGKKARVTVMYK